MSIKVGFVKASGPNRRTSQRNWSTGAALPTNLTQHQFLLYSLFKVFRLEANFNVFTGHLNSRACGTISLALSTPDTGIYVLY